MQIEPIYYAIFYDLAKPKKIHYALNKKIERTLFQNLTDEMGTKTVVLKSHDNVVTNYEIVSTSTFEISNTVDICLFVVCDCEKIN